MITQWMLGPVETFTIGNGANGSAVAAVDLRGQYKAVRISCADCSNIPATTALAAMIGYGAGDTLCDLYAENDPATKFLKGDLPTSGTLAFVLTHAQGAQRIRLLLNKNASGGSVVFIVQGLDKGG